MIALNVFPILNVVGIPAYIIGTLLVRQANENVDYNVEFIMLALYMNVYSSFLSKVA